jgi:hypothetical protein
LTLPPKGVLSIVSLRQKIRLSDSTETDGCSNDADSAQQVTVNTSPGVAASRKRQGPLKPAQERVLEEFAAGRPEITRADYERLGHVSRSQAAYDLAELVDRRVLERIGSGRATRYRAPRNRSGRPRSWTSERIHSELSAFCAGRESWPSAAEFRSSGHGSLYLAVCRYGGIDHWADALGLARTTPDDAPVHLERAPSKRLARWRERLRPLIVPTLVLAATAVAGVAAWLASASDDGLPVVPRSSREAGPVTGEASRPAADARTSKQLAGAAVSRDRKVVVRLIGVRSDSRVIARRNSSRGRLLFAGVLRASASLRLEGRRIWVRLGTPRAVRLLIDGSPATLARTARTFLVTQDGVRVVRTPTPQPLPGSSGSAGIPISVDDPSSATPAADNSPPAPAPAPGSSSSDGSASSGGNGASSSADGGTPAPDPPEEGPAPDPKPD